MAVLKKMTDVAVRVAEALGERAVAAVEAAEHGEAEDRGAARRFNAAARCVRQTVALEARLSEGLVKLESASGDGRASWAAQMDGAAERVDEMLRRLIESGDDEDEDYAAEDDDGVAPTERPERAEREHLADPCEAEGFERAMARAGAGPRAATGPLHRPADGSRSPEGEGNHPKPGGGGWPLQRFEADRTHVSAGRPPGETGIERPSG